jgi:hypothetical protein
MGWSSTLSWNSLITCGIGKKHHPWTNVSAAADTRLIFPPNGCLSSRGLLCSCQIFKLLWGSNLGSPSVTQGMIGYTNWIEGKKEATNESIYSICHCWAVITNWQQTIPLSGWFLGFITMVPWKNQDDLLKFACVNLRHLPPRTPWTSSF